MSWYSALWLAARLPLCVSAGVPIRFHNSWMAWGYTAAYTRKLLLTLTIIFDGFCHNVFCASEMRGEYKSDCKALVRFNYGQVNVICCCS